MSDNSNQAESTAKSVENGTSRRGLLAKAGIVGAAIAGAQLLGVGKTNFARGAEVARFGPKGNHFVIQDVDILNFALNLEYLEAEFYQRAAFGVGLGASDTSGKGTEGVVFGGSQVPFTSNVIAQYAQEIATDELNHVKFLRAALGSSAVARPTIDLSTAFTTAAVAAGVISSGQTFDPFADDDSFLLGAFIFEDVGVTAYHGAAPLVRNPDYLSAAAGILGVEAYHAGLVRTLLFGMGQTSPSLITAANKISDLRNAASTAADGAGTTDEGITTSAGTGNIVPTDANSIAFARSFAEVLNIVYLGRDSGGFGFFPNGLNGRIA